MAKKHKFYKNFCKNYNFFWINYVQTQKKVLIYG